MPERTEGDDNDGPITTCLAAMSLDDEPVFLVVLHLNDEVTLMVDLKDLDLHT